MHEKDNNFVLSAPITLGLYLCTLELFFHLFLLLRHP